MCFFVRRRLVRILQAEDCEASKPSMPAKFGHRGGGKARGLVDIDRRQTLEEEEEGAPYAAQPTRAGLTSETAVARGLRIARVRSADAKQGAGERGGRGKGEE